MLALPWLRRLQRRWFPRRVIRRASIQRVRLGLEALEERLTPSTYGVTDASDVLLRYSIAQAISNHDPNTVIGFSSALAGQTITSGLLTEIDLGPLHLPVTYTPVFDNVLVSIAGVPWQMQFFGPQHQPLGTATLVIVGTGPVEWLLANAAGLPVGEIRLDTGRHCGCGGKVPA